MARLVALGGLALVDTDGPMAGSAGRGRNLALLVLLARAGDAGITRDKVAALLWPESDEARARHSLDQALYTLRRALGTDAVVTAGATLALGEGIVATDVGEFDAARAEGDREAAVSLYAGPFLDGFHLGGAPEFEAWVAGERAELHAAHVEALESLATAATEAGDHGTAVARWRALAGAEPLSSRVARGLMRALERAGDRAGALESARVHGALVEEELGAPPDPSIVAYERELRQAPPAPAAPAAAPPPATRRPDGPTTQRAPASAPTRRWPLLVAAGAGVVLVAAMALGRGRDTPALLPTLPPSVLVTPFENESGDATLGSLGTMASDWITEGLVRTGIVRVVGPGRPAGEAHAIVSGRLYRTTDSVWLQARISRAEDGRVLRVSDPVSAPADEPSRALEPLRQQVLGALGTLYDPRLTAWAETALRPPSYKAFQQFAAGLELFSTPREFDAAGARFRRAAELDPDYVLPRLWWAWASVVERRFERADSIAGVLAATREAMSPLERAWLDRIQALLDGDNERSFRAAGRMVEVAPGSGWVIALASSALDTNRPRVAATALRDAGIESLGLETGFGYFLLTVALHQLGDYPEELEIAEEGVRRAGLGWGYLGPGVSGLAALGRIDALERRLDELRDQPPLDDGVPRAIASLRGAALELRAHGFREEASDLVARRLPDVPASTVSDGPGHWARMTLLYEMGRWREADAALHALPAAVSDSVPWRAVAALLAVREGDVATARRIDAELAAVDEPWSFGEATFWRARIHAALDDGDTALALLRQSFAEGQGGRAWQDVHVSRDFDPLRRTPAFSALIRPGSWPGPGAAP